MLANLTPFLGVCELWALHREKHVCPMETFKSAAGFIVSDNWKFIFFNYCSRLIEVIVYVA